jgi:hypothetical protein
LGLCDEKRNSNIESSGAVSNLNEASNLSTSSSSLAAPSQAQLACDLSGEYRMETQSITSIASQDSTAGSIGDQFVINKHSDLFNTKKDETFSFFAPQQTERKIINLFDDEPPEIPDFFDTSEPKNNNNDFNDYIGSVESLPTQSATLETPKRFDLFGDEDQEFDKFIEKIEKEKKVSRAEDKIREKVHEPRNIQDAMRAIAMEIKENPPPQKQETAIIIKAQENVKTNEISPIKQVLGEKTATTPALNEKPATEAQISQPKIDSTIKTRPKMRVTNLFEDDDDDNDESEDIFSKIVQSKKSDVVKEPEVPIQNKNLKENVFKTKFKSLFDDEDDDDEEINGDNKANIDKGREEPKTIFEDKKKVSESGECAPTPIENISSSSSGIPTATSEQEEIRTTEAIERVQESPPSNELNFSAISKISVPKFESSVPFLNDIPPDDEAWDTFDENATTASNYDEIETKTPEKNENHGYNNFSIPLFSDTPPDDNFEIGNTSSSNNNTQLNMKADEIGDKNDEEISRDDVDRSISATKSIKDKLDLFLKPKEFVEAEQDKLKTKPGRLNTNNIKINVNALLPGAKITTTKSEENSSNVDSTHSSLLNNEIIKSRAKSLKRKPSTRQARKSLYEKSQLENNEKETKEDVKKESKIAVYYDDESETKDSIEKYNNEIKEREVAKNLAPKDNKIASKSLFDNDSDEDDIFGSKSTKKPETSPQNSDLKKGSIKTAAKATLFDSDSDGDDLFSTKSKGVR